MASARRGRNNSCQKFIALNNLEQNNGKDTERDFKKGITNRDKTTQIGQIMIGNVAKGIDKMGLYNILKEYGEVLAVRFSGIKTFGFADFRSEEDANSAIQSLHRKPPYNFIVRFANNANKINNVKNEPRKSYAEPRIPTSNIDIEHSLLGQNTSFTSSEESIEGEPCTLCKNKCTKECSSCSAPYCNVPCQVKDWPRHSSLCREIPKLVDAKNLKTLNIVGQDNKKTSARKSLRHTENKIDNKIQSEKSTLSGINGSKIITPFMRLQAAANRIKLERNAREDQTIREAWQTSVTISDSCYTKVMVMSQNGNGSFQVILTSNVDIVQDLLEEANKEPYLECESNIRTGKLCLAVFDDLYCRAKIISVNPLKVYFLDYGNEREISRDILKKLPSDYFTKIPAQSINIIVSQGGTATLEVCKEAEVIHTTKIINGALEVKIKGDKYRTNNTPLSKMISAKSDTILPTKCNKNVMKGSTSSFSDSNSNNGSLDNFTLINTLQNSIVYPELAIGTYTKVTVQYVEQDFVWVADKDYANCAANMLLKINSSTVSRKPLSNIQVGVCGVVQFEGILYRSIIINERPLTVRLLDYGNLIHVEANEIWEIVDEDILTQNPYVIKIALAPGISFKFSELQECEIKAIEKKNDYYIVVVKGFESNLDTIKKRDLLDFLKETASGNLVTKTLHCNNQAIVIFQIPSLLDAFNSAHKRVQNEFLTEHKCINAKIGDSVLVKYQQNLQRGEVLSIKDNQKYVLALYDVGVIFESNNVYKLPMYLLNVPRQIYNLKVIKLNGCPKMFYSNMTKRNTISFKVKLLEPLIEVICSFSENPKDVFTANITQWVPVLSILSLPVLPVPDQTKEKIVTITDCTNQHKIYVRDADKVNNDKYNQLMNQVAIHAAKAEPIKLLPVIYEPVMALYEDDGSYYRALITKLNSDDTAEVFYTEFGNIANVQLKNLKEMSNELKGQPASIYKISLLDVPEGPLPDEASLLLDDILNETSPLRFKLMFGNSSNGVHLLYPDGTSLNEKIAAFITPPCVESEHLLDEKEKEVDQLEDTIYLKDLKIKPIPTGENVSVFVLETHLLSKYAMLFGCHNEPNFIQKVLVDMTSLMTKYCEETEGPYLPAMEEVCIAKFPSDDTWCRAVCVDPRKDLCQLFNVDLGTITDINVKNIRRMDPQFNVIEVLAAQLYIKDLEPPLSEEQVELIINYLNLSEYSIVGPLQKKDELESDEYVIELPKDIMRKLKVV